MAAWLTSLIRARPLELGLALALGYALARTAEEIAAIPVRVLAQHVGDDPYFGGDTVLDLQGLFSVGVYLLNFEIGGTVFFYGNVLAAAASLGLVALVAVFVVRRRDRVLGVCPFCASRIPYESTHCAYCGSGIAPGDP